MSHIDDATCDWHKQVPASSTGEPQRVDLHKNSAASVSTRTKAAYRFCPRTRWAQGQTWGSWPSVNLPSSETRHLNWNLDFQSPERISGFKPWILQNVFLLFPYLESIRTTALVNNTGKYNMSSHTCCWKHPLADWLPTDSWPFLHPAFLCCQPSR